MAKTKSTDELMARTDPEPSGLITPPPSFMQNETKMGTEEVRSGIVPPFVKIIQRNAEGEYLKDFNPGDVLVVPLKRPVVRVQLDQKSGKHVFPGPAFKVNPIYMWREWITWSPYETKGSEPAIRARSLDPACDIAKKSRDPKVRREKVANGHLLHCECLNFIVRLCGVDDPELEALRPILTFQRGEFMTGSRFCQMIMMRKSAIYGQKFEFRTNVHKNPQFEWIGFDITNPTDGDAWINSPEEYAAMREEHMAFEHLLRSGKVEVDYEQAVDGAEVESEGGKAEF